MRKILTPIITLLLAAGIGWTMADHTASISPEAVVRTSHGHTVYVRPVAPATAPRPVESLTDRLRAKGLRYVKTVKHGHVIGYIDAPRLRLHHWAVREGVQESILNRGPGHYPGTTLPGLGGTTAIAGHDVTPVNGWPYGPFHWLNLMRPGDKVTLHMPYGTYTYTFHRSLIIDPSDTTVDRYVGRDRLVLSMCWPRYTALHRWVVVLWLTQVHPVN